MLRCIAIDDEPLALELLEDNIRYVPFLEHVASFDSPVQALKFLQEQQVDLVFIDIQMPGLTGLQFIESVANKPMFILITAYEQFALKGYDLDVIDYLLKPVEVPRFIQACNKARARHELQLKESGSTVSHETTDYIFVNVDYSLVKVVLADILFIEGLKDYIKIHLRGNAKPIVTRMAMKGIEEQLPAHQFLRIHKSFIAAKAAITAVRKNIVFIGNIELPVGDNYKDSLDQFINPRSSG